MILPPLVFPANCLPALARSLLQLDSLCKRASSFEFSRLLNLIFFSPFFPWQNHLFRELFSSRNVANRVTRSRMTLSQMFQLQTVKNMGNVSEMSS